MSLNVLPELLAGPSDLIALVEITLLIVVSVVAYWLVRAAQRAERAWCEECTRSALSQRTLVRQRMSAEDAASDKPEWWSNRNHRLSHLFSKLSS